MTRKIFMFIIFFTLSLLTTLRVAGHGYIERTDPIDGSELAEAPARIRVWFSEPLVPASGKISMVNGVGENIDLLKVYHSETVNSLVMADVPPDLPNGIYIVTASGVVVSDGHKPQGSFTFWIGSKTAQTASAKNSPAYEILGLFTGIFVVAGIVGLWQLRQPALEMTPSSDSIDQFWLE